ncbi:MAG: hypothetical protein LUG98_07525 [Tannerellaceae bacterium]|nr:hypothetical protein [Tannerellaceae bacterium]
MKNLLLKSLLVMFLTGFFYACEDKESSEMTKEELQKELERVKAILEANTQITNVSYEGDKMVLTFANGQTFTTGIPSNVIPEIGSNGNWYINGEDLGVSAQGVAPVIGANGNWWVGTEDTGVKAEGMKGEKGDDGNGISDITYDPETATLTIILSDGTQFPFIIGATGDGNVGGILIGDLNGEYLLTSITNGDLPFMTLKYDDRNNLTNIDYYTNVLNAAERIAGLTQTYTNGKVTNHRLVEYAEIDKVLPVTAVFPDRDYWYWDWDYNGNPLKDKYLNKYTGSELYDEFFPDGYPGVNTKDKKELVIEYLMHKYYYDRYFYSVNSVYEYEGEEYEGDNRIYRILKFPKSFYTKEGERGKQYILSKEGNTTYFYLPYYGWNDYYVNQVGDDEKWEYSWYGYYGDLSSISIYMEDDFIYEVQLSDGEHMTTPFKNVEMRVKATVSNGEKGVINGNKLTNYFIPDTKDILYLDGLSGNYQTLYCEYLMYKKGDEIDGVEINYAHSANDIKASFEGQVVANVTIENDRINKVIIIDGDGKKQEILSFKYEGEKLKFIDAPFANVTEFAKFEYDSKGNVREMLVHSGKLKGQGVEDILYSLGLITTYTYYDPELGRVVYGYKYSDDYVSTVKISYNYGYKNFMNHTLVAANPILSFFKFENAIEEINWSGHGSCLLAEYSNFNEGGYPQRIKGILQYSPVEDPDGDMQPPVNGAVATLYKLNYEKKK